MNDKWKAFYSDPSTTYFKPMARKEREDVIARYRAKTGRVGDGSMGGSAKLTEPELAQVQSLYAEMVARDPNNRNDINELSGIQQGNFRHMKFFSQAQELYEQMEAGMSSPRADPDVMQAWIDECFAAVARCSEICDDLRAEMQERLPFGENQDQVMRIGEISKEMWELIQLRVKFIQLLVTYASPFLKKQQNDELKDELSMTETATSTKTTKKAKDMSVKASK